jgi:Bacterial Ig-like domain (group 3)
VGQSETDSVLVTGEEEDGNPTGNVTFFVCAKGTGQCFSGGTSLGAVALKAKGSFEATAASASFTPSEAGTYCFRAEYEGDETYEVSSDASADECFTVMPAAKSPTTTTSVSSGTIVLGEAETDSATVTGNSAAPTGSVRFFVCPPGAGLCFSGGKEVGGAVSLTPGSGNASTAKSASFTPGRRA